MAKDSVLNKDKNEKKVVSEEKKRGLIQSSKILLDKNLKEDLLNFARNSKKWQSMSDDVGRVIQESKKVKSL